MARTRHDRGWPPITCRIDGTDVSLDVAGAHATWTAPTLEAARTLARGRLIALAGHFRRPLSAHLVDPDGTWSINLHPDGTITEPGTTGRRP
ncbi:hypothetical protein [Acidipropionibacterium timonense]|uniref:hypothetical protein n=1 Tax=Acidipropionibacterium timonense TaxID=2161818 RepID=UPI001030BF4D|nr:hypothetical protein [Acidipropionibacterium timonense]